VADNGNLQRGVFEWSLHGDVHAREQALQRQHA
jgi:hypothetical protein